MQQLFAAIRDISDKQTWSKAVELVRQNGVMREKLTGDEIVCRVKEAGKSIWPIVSLWPADEDWHCDCGGDEDPCLHVVAAVIALRQTAEPMLAAAGKLIYRFLRQGDGKIGFFRWVLIDHRPLPLPGSLAAITSGRIRGPRVAPTKDDFAVELCLGNNTAADLPAAVWPKLFKALAPCSDLTLDGQPVTVSSEPTCGVQLVVKDEGGGVSLRGEQDPSIDEVFSNGVVRSQQTLRAIVQPKLTHDQLEIMASGKYFGASQLVEVASEILPAFAKKLPVVSLSQRLGTDVVAVPRLTLTSSYEGETLKLVGCIVYGDPEIARLVRGRLVCSNPQAVPRRNLDAERQLQNQFVAKFGVACEEPIIATGEDACRLIADIQPVVADGRFGLSFADTPWQRFIVREPLDASTRIEAVGSGYRCEIDFTSAHGQADPERVLEAFHAGRSLVPLLDGGYAPIPSDWLQRYGAKIRDLLAARDADHVVPRCFRFDLVDLGQSQGFELPALPATMPPTMPSDAELSLPVAADLRSYQVEGVRWLDGLKKTGLGALLADDMGLGKTLQAICVIDGPALIVSPTSVLFNWHHELSRFRPQATICVYHGSQRQLDQSADVVLTTYAILRLDLDLLSARHWRSVVLDEAQVIKNPDSQVAQAVFRLKADFRLSLSGTPVENHLTDIWSQFHFLNRGLLGSYASFQKHYARRIADGDQLLSSELHRRLQPFILRRLKRDVAKELPPRTEMVLTCELSDDERLVYDSLRLIARQEILAKLDATGNVMQALELLLRLRQAACHRALLPNQTATSSSKLELLLDEVKNSLENHHKVLVFSQWTKLLDLIAQDMTACQIRFDRIDGATKDRQQVVDKFQAPDGVQVLLLSIKAAGTGLNLTAADHVFIVDPWWNPAVEDQAADRSHRIGQTKPVLIRKLVAKDTVEEKILALQNRKRQLAEMVVGSGVDSSLSATEIAGLLI